MPGALFLPLQRAHLAGSPCRFSVHENRAFRFSGCYALFTQPLYDGGISGSGEPDPFALSWKSIKELYE
jgi:hypothetical protein